MYVHVNNEKNSQSSTDVHCKREPKTFRFNFGLSPTSAKWRLTSFQVGNCRYAAWDRETAEAGSRVDECLVVHQRTPTAYSSTVRHQLQSTTLKMAVQEWTTSGHFKCLAFSHFKCLAFSHFKCWHLATLMFGIQSLQNVWHFSHFKCQAVSHFLCLTLSQLKPLEFSYLKCLALSHFTGLACRHFKCLTWNVKS